MTELYDPEGRLAHFLGHLHLVSRDPQAPPEQRYWEEGLVPELPLAPPRPRSRQESEAHELIKAQPLLELYRRFITKGEGPLLHGREQVVSCPNPAHEDRRPSACINVVDNVGNCFACQMGFDQYDVYAWYAGYDVPDYKTNGDFGLLRRELTGMLGFEVFQESGLELIVPLAEQGDDDGEAPDYVSPYDDPDAPGDDEDGDEDEGPGAQIVKMIMPEPPRYDLPSLDFLGIFDESSHFVRPFVERLAAQPFPDEYHGWGALLALAFALGNDCRLEDNPMVRANLLVCFVGESGTGKSSSLDAVGEVLRQGLPDVRALGTPNSAEGLLDLFCDPIDDPLNPGGPPTGYNQVRALIDIPELSSFTVRSSRLGNDIKSRLMDLYDSAAPRKDHSRGTGNDGRKGVAENHFMQVISTTQPERVQELLSKADKVSGFLNRWLFAWGTPKPQTEATVWRQPLPNLGDLAYELRTTRQWAVHRPSIRVDDAAKSRFAKWVLGTFRPNFQGDMFGRVELLLKKLCLLITADKREEVVSVETVEQALQFWPYLAATYGFVDDRTEETGDRPEAVSARERVMSAARRIVIETNRQPTKTDIRMASGKSWWQRNLGMAEKEFKLLVDSGFLVPIPPPPAGKRKPGRPAIRYNVDMD